MPKELIVKEIAKSFGTDESSSVELWADTATGESKLVISKTITERYPITDYDKVMDLYKKLNRGGGRTIPSLEDLTK